MKNKKMALVAIFLFITISTALGSQDTAPPDAPIPSESECRPYIEKALKEKDHTGTEQESEQPASDDSLEDTQSTSEGQVGGATEGGSESEEGTEPATTNTVTNSDTKTEDLKAENDSVESKEEGGVENVESVEDAASVEEQEAVESVEETKETETLTRNERDTKQEAEEEEDAKSVEESVEDDAASVEQVEDDKTKTDKKEEEKEDTKSQESVEEEVEEEKKTIKDDSIESKEEEEVKPIETKTKQKEEVKEKEIIKETVKKDLKEDEKPKEEEKESGEEGDDKESPEEEDLTLGIIIPDNLRDKKHVKDILKLDEDTKEEEELLAKTVESTLKELKRLYDNTIKPLELLYKYRDLSNRHFSDPEIFSKPLVLFMGPWSGGKSSIINYLLDNEYTHNSLRTGAEPSPAYFNILSWGESPTVLDGTQLAADWTFSGLQKFGQGLLDRLRGLQLPHPLLEKINIVEIPGILEIRKQVERQFPFNDACQWFIDRADIIFLVYDPSKLDVGPETEAILDQLKGREYQTRIILNKADQVKPEELMRVQGTLIWNISPLMSSSEPPIMYSTSLWSNPYEIGAPIRLLQAQETAFLRDLRHAIDKRVENKIASARRFAVRVRNHAKMVDCYLTTYYNHKTFFGNRKKIADDIIEHPQNYHIYAGLSTLTNISRYDLPDPEVYRDFFRLNPVFEFKKLSDTCTYFRGCPINRLDVTIAYDLPELVGKYKKTAEQLLKENASKKQKEKPDKS